jgi:hypothetical protein
MKFTPSDGVALRVWDRARVRRAGRETRGHGVSRVGDGPTSEATGAEFLRTKFVLLFILCSNREETSQPNAASDPCKD